MFDILFDVPWWLPAAPIAVGAIVAFTGMRRLEKNVTRGGLSILLAGVLIGLLSYFIDTNREKAIRRTHALVSTAAARDWRAFAALIDPQTSVYSLKGPVQITDAAKQVVDRFDVTTARVIGTEAVQRDTVIVVTIRVYSEQRGRSGMSDWRMEFQDQGSGWILYDVSVLPSDLISAERIRSAIPEGR